MAKPVKEINYANSLIEISRGMLTKLHSSGAPPQSILRRCTSNAYYALFHCLCNGGARILHNHDNSRKFSARAFKHDRMYSIFDKDFNSNILSDDRKRFRHFYNENVLEKIVDLSNSFTQLQNKRHQADYDFEISFKKSEVIESLVDAENAIKLYEELYLHWRENLKTLISILLYEKISQAL